ncbi:6-phosphofructokinase, partial [Cardiosporidium cionae]
MSSLNPSVPSRLRSLSVISYNNQYKLFSGTEEDRELASAGKSAKSPCQKHEISGKDKEVSLHREENPREAFPKRAPLSKSHHHSAELSENFSPFQEERRLWQPTLPKALRGAYHTLCNEISEAHPPSECPAELLEFLPATGGISHYVEIIPEEDFSSISINGRPLRVGIILSGGPAPGGHNVIAGLFDYLKMRNSNSQLYGFLGGLDGFFEKKFEVIMEEEMNLFRNQGGFDMVWSGRGRVKDEEDLKTALQISQTLELDGLVIVGGDGSNSNAALLAEYFYKNSCICNVVGVPKTIDGDLKNVFIETSFGFDTAAKTYSELIGNLCNDARTSQKTYHFIRVMGRSASHLVLECALQTRPNLVFIGEEIEFTNQSLQKKYLQILFLLKFLHELFSKGVVNQILTLICRRRDQGKCYGVILVPEGLIEFFPEMKTLFNEINAALKNGNFHPSMLQKSRAIWEYLPEIIQIQLLMDREASGYIQVAKIATERLLILLVENEIDKFVWRDSIDFIPHYFGYEGRCAMPSNFDANYCYALGCTSGVLLENKKTGYMSVIRNLKSPVEFWKPAGVPFWKLMSVKNISNQKKEVAITRQLVDLEGPLFQLLAQVRTGWELNDLYSYVGPIQFEGPLSDCCCCTIDLPEPESLKISDVEMTIDGKMENSSLNLPFMSALQILRMDFIPPLPALCRALMSVSIPGKIYTNDDPYTQKQIIHRYPHLAAKTQFQVMEFIQEKTASTATVSSSSIEESSTWNFPSRVGLRIGIVFLSRQSPGAMNIIWGLFERIHSFQGKIFGFFGLKGLLEGDFVEISPSMMRLYRNSGGIELVGRSPVHMLLSKEELSSIREQCRLSCLDGLVLPGSAIALSIAANLSDYFISTNCSTHVVGVPCTGSNNLLHELIEGCVGFDSSTKVYASLIGNVLTDAASMPKYWHFVRLMGRQPSHE